MRVCLGIVFLFFGIGKFNNDIWAETIRAMDFFIKLPWDVNISVYLIGALEILTGAALVSGLFARFFAGIASIQLMAILILLKFQEIRDIGLFGAALYMAITKHECWSVNSFFKKK